MFRRKTDQVYATLQQVQRRISQANQGGGDGLEQDVTFAPARRQTAGNPGIAETAVPNDAPMVKVSAEESPRIDAPMPAPSPMMSKVASAATLPAAWQAAPRRPSLVLPWEAASIIFLLWLGSLVGVFFIGRQVGHRAEAVASGPVLSREAFTTNGSAAQKPRQILLLDSVPRASAAVESRFRGDVERLNQFARQNARHGYQPWFSVRKPTSGGLQLIFGETDGVLGVDPADFTALAAGLKTAGYKDPRWVDPQ